MLDRIRFGRFELRLTERKLLADGQALVVGARAFDLLQALIERRERLVTKAELLDVVWPGLVVEESNIQVQVSALRRVLGGDAIATVPGLGYRFAMTCETDAASVDGAPGGLPALSADAEPRAPRDAASNLPSAVRSLVGREADVEALTQALAAHRLVTVVGSGGIGKTSVAQEAARRQVGRHPDGVWWVDLGAVASAEHLAAAIANAAHLALGDNSTDTIEPLLRALAPRRTLLVLDNCEHLAGPVGHLADAVLAAAAGVHLLVTSQGVLHARGEQLYRLEPLRVPAADATLPEASGCSAMQLLLQRTCAADRRFTVDESNLAAAIALLRHLDGMPLAIEMAAARVPMLGLQGLSDRLVEWSRLLRNVERAVPARQQTLQATLDWSYSLLAPTEQRVLRQMSIFSGSVRVETFQQALRDEDLDEWAALDTLASLVDKSLVQVARVEPPRYRLLETMRLFAARRREDLGETPSVLQRHATAMAALADEVEASYWEMADRPWLARFAPDYDDLQAAFDRACDRGDANVAARIGIALWRLDGQRSLNAPRQRRARALHALLPHADALARALIWTCIASHGLITLEVVSRLEASTQAVAAWRTLQDPARLHFALGFHAAECARVLDFAAAEAALAELRALEDPGWPLRRQMWSASAAAGVCIHRGDAAGYRAASRAELALAERAGAERAAAWARLKLADAALMAGELEESIALGRVAVANLRELDQPSNLGLALTNLCAALILKGDDALGRDTAVQALPLMCSNGWSYLLLDSVALLAARGGDHERAAHLLGHVDAWYRKHSDERQPNEATLARQGAALLAAARGAVEADAMRAAGQHLSDAAAQALARSVLGLPPARAL